MDSMPPLDTVYQAVYSLYESPNPAEKETASVWLGDLQKSVCAWKISDEMLREKKNLQSCYFAAQTMRTKIQMCFHELPVSSHVSLRDSLLDHISQINKNTNTVIVTQLCLALADLILQMASWEDPIKDLIQKFGDSPESLWPLLEILIVLPEEVNSRFPRLGANRREQVTTNFTANGDAVLEFLNGCLKNVDDVQIYIRVLRCFTSWITIYAISLTTPLFSNLMTLAFEVLQNNLSGSQLHEVAADCISVILQVLEENTLRNRDPNTNEPILQLQHLQFDLFSRIVTLEQPYHVSVAHEDMDKSTNYCRIFTELAETFLGTIVDGSMNGKQHYAIRALDFALVCVGHHDYEVAQITFNLWYKLSEILYQRDNNELTCVFKPYIERLIEALCRHCQMEPDHLGLIEEGDGFADFRSHVVELIKDVVFVVGSSHCFRQMFATLTGGAQGQTVPTWDMTEAALFVMQAVAKNILPEENDVVPKVVEAILNLPENTHIAVRHTSILLLGELCEWINSHPQSLEPILNFLLTCLSQKGLGSAACNALQCICTACPKHMATHFQGLLQIARNLDNFAIGNDAAVNLLKGVAKILSLIPKEEMESSMKELCWFQAKPLCHLMEEHIKERGSVTRATKADPILWLDRLAAIFRHTTPSHEDCKDSHPCQAAANEMWPVVSNACSIYREDPRIMERCCRCLRFMIRCLGKHSAHILEPLVKQIIQLYAEHQHSCFVYLGSILVDVFGTDMEYISGLLGMLEAFIGPTFTILQENDGLKNHPDTVDDFFRLCARFLQTTPVPFLHSPMMNSILDCALMASSLDHRDANGSVMKFFSDLLHSGRASENRSDFSIRRQLVQDIIREKGQLLVTTLLHAAVFSLSSYMMSDVAEVLVELSLTNRELMSIWLEQAIAQMPSQSVIGSPTATPDQLLEFHSTVIEAQNPKIVVCALRNFTRLYR